MMTPGVETVPSPVSSSPNGTPESRAEIIFDNVSRFYGDVLGINRVNLRIPPGITSLVGPNGSGKTTLMNLMTGLIHPTCGHISVLGMTPGDPEKFFRAVGYCTQFDSFAKGITGREFIEFGLKLHGYSRQVAADKTAAVLDSVSMTEAADRKVAAYSKGMRQRIRLAHAIAHDPQVLVLDEPLNGLDPMARAETMALFQKLAAQGCHVIISSHILHEVDKISDQVILLSYGYVVAEGQIRGVREEVKDHPMQILIRCDRPGALAARLFEAGTIVEARVVPPEGIRGQGLLIRTTDATSFYTGLNRIVLEDDLNVESVAPADDDVLSVYQYLIGGEGVNS